MKERNDNNLNLMMMHIFKITFKLVFNFIIDKTIKYNENAFKNKLNLLFLLLI